MFYSKLLNQWFDPELRDAYEENGNWPADAVEYSQEIYDQTVRNRPRNKVMQPDEDGKPTLVDLQESEVKQTRFSPLEFLEKFTDAEQLSVVEATMTIAQVKLWYDKMLASTYVDITDPRTTGGLAALVAANLLTEERKGEILEA